MTKKVNTLAAKRRKRKPLSLDEIAKNAFQQYCDPDFLDSIGEEPIALASGRPNAHGGFVRDEEDDLLADQELGEIATSQLIGTDAK